MFTPNWHTSEEVYIHTERMVFLSYNITTENSKFSRLTIALNAFDVFINSECESVGNVAKNQKFLEKII